MLLAKYVLHNVFWVKSKKKKKKREKNYAI